MNLKPNYDRVVIIPDVHEEKTVGGLYIPSAARDDEKIQRGKVVAIGNKENLEVAVGDNVIYEKHQGVTIELEGKDIIVMKEEGVLGVVVYKEN